MAEKWEGEGRNRNLSMVPPKQRFFYNHADGPTDRPADRLFCICRIMQRTWKVKNGKDKVRIEP